MNEQLTQQYDSLYASKDVVFGDGEPIPAVQKLPEYLRSGSVLDIGGGEGRNALFLARAGYQVTVTDLSQVGIEKLQKVAEKEKLSIHARVSDVVQEGIIGEYDAMLCTFVMHHLAVSDAHALVMNMQSHTNPNGIHIITTFLDKGDLAARNQKSGSGRYYPEEQDLASLYQDWEMILYKARETTTHARDKAGNRLKNMMVVLIARKPD